MFWCIRNANADGESMRFGFAEFDGVFGTIECGKPFAGVPQANAFRILIAVGVLALPKLECESSATLGVKPNRCTSSAARIVISAICSAVGSKLTFVSQMNN